MPSPPSLRILEVGSLEEHPIGTRRRIHLASYPLSWRQVFASARDAIGKKLEIGGALSLEGA